MKTQNIALVFPESTFLIDPMVYPPLGLWYLAAQLEAIGHKTTFFDLSVDSLPADGEFDQIWLGGTSPQMSRIRHWGNTLKGYEKTATVLGGAAPWARADECANLGYDVVISGEADQPDLVQNILDLGEQYKGTHNGHLKLYGTRLGKNSMDLVLPPIRRWSYRYHATLEDHNGYQHPTTTMFTSRGCPMACVFCESGRNGVIWDAIVRYEPIETVEAQIREIAELGYTGIMFYDDILPLNKPRMQQILALLRKYNLVWRCFIRTDVIAKQGGFAYLREMADAGLLEVLAGVESADNRIKTNIHKGTTIEQDTQALAWCKELGIKFKSSFILGLPGESMESMARTRDWILHNRPDRVDVNILIPFPGTPITSDTASFDLYWTKELPEELWYKGPRDESLAIVGTSHLTPAEIAAFRDGLIKEIEDAGIPY